MPPMSRELNRPPSASTPTPTRSPDASRATASGSSSRGSARQSGHSQASPSRRSSRPYLYQHTPSRNTVYGTPYQWHDDPLGDNSLPWAPLAPASPDQLYLTQLAASNDFASPSWPSWPSPYSAFTNSPAVQAIHTGQAERQPDATTPSRNAASAPHRTSHSRIVSAPSRSTTQLGSCAAIESPNTSFTSDSIVNTESQSSNSSFSETMPTTRRASRVKLDAATNKRPKLEDSAPQPIPPTGPLVLPAAMAYDDDDLFGDKFMDQQLSAESGDLTTIDLTEANAVPEELRQPDVDNRVKISKFQCVICMDDATTLTVTHCGHLYCAECLHSALHVEATRNKCPMCRAKIDIKARSTYTSKTKGFWPLELKLMTATKKGKRKADDIS